MVRTGVTERFLLGRWWRGLFDDVVNSADRRFDFLPPFVGEIDRLSLAFSGMNQDAIPLDVGHTVEIPEVIRQLHLSRLGQRRGGFHLDDAAVVQQVERDHPEGEILPFVAVGRLVNAGATDDGRVLAVDFEVPALEPEFPLADVVVLHHDARDAERFVDRLATGRC